ncbi:hypothetical protein CALVIDRAFT_82138 [Calocera viscosa TUFC12733]|uniref:Uncharacterized protein n=1 Tax=Calocera viscosa (strain TUFC12733) TaxID=1330018 RepID=A0A167N1T2_CALVF|nr:hypothetical protein CALVIDRAFT_82138 [Calocera viscosa TUFC12733]
MAAEKEKSKTLKTINKLVPDKKDTLPDMFIEICSALDESPQFQPIAHHVRAMIVEKSGHPGAGDWPIRVVDELDPPNTICWRRRVTARFDKGKRQFVPLDHPQSVMENARLLYLQEEHLQNGLKNGRFEQTVQRLRDELCPNGLLFAMIDGSSGSKVIERQLTMMMMKHRLNVIRVEGPEDAATWLYDITADLGFKPHRYELYVNPVHN